MIRARSSLFRQINAFFDTHLRGVYSFGEAEAIDPVDAVPEAPLPGRRQETRLKYGKHAEIVGVLFGVFELVVFSSNEKGPLGLVELRARGGGVLESGPIDDVTWRNIASHIKRGNEDGYRRSEGSGASGERSRPEGRGHW